MVPALPARSSDGIERHGVVEFPRDEHVHPDGWDFWWGAADLVTTTGNRYSVAIAHDSLNGIAVSGHELYAWQGPYRGSTVASPEGPAEWGHEGAPPGRFVETASAYVPGVNELFRYETFDAHAGGRRIGVWERTSLAEHSYRLVFDHDEAYVHPAGDNIRLGLELEARMANPPLLLGGDGRFWYGIPQGIGYPSRSFQYMQTAEALSGTLELGQPDGSVVREQIDPAGSRLLMVHEYDATPEDLPGGLGLALLSQVHERYPQYYQGGMPWELLFMDLGNGAQLFLAVIAFHDTEDAALHPVFGRDMPTYKLFATLRLPTGESVPLDDEVRLEHLAYRTTVGRVPTFWLLVTGIWTQAWTYRVSYPGGTVATGDGTVAVPPFDIGLTPRFRQDEPLRDEQGNGQRQRIPFAVSGSYDGCRVDGFAFSEIIVNWYGHEQDDPWFTGGDPPPVPVGCAGRGGSGGSGGTGGEPVPSQSPDGQPEVSPSEGCQAYDPGAPMCEYTAATNAGIFGSSGTPGGWTVTIERPGRTDPIEVRSLGGTETYACGIIRPGDTVTVTAGPGSGATVGNPGFCW